MLLFVSRPSFGVVVCPAHDLNFVIRRTCCTSTKLAVRVGGSRRPLYVAAANTADTASMTKIATPNMIFRITSPVYIPGACVFKPVCDIQWRMKVPDTFIHLYPLTRLTRIYQLRNPRRIGLYQ